MNNSQNEGGKEIKRRARRVITGGTSSTGPIAGGAQTDVEADATPQAESSQATAVASHEAEARMENGVESSTIQSGEVMLAEPAIETEVEAEAGMEATEVEAVQTTGRTVVTSDLEADLEAEDESEELLPMPVGTEVAGKYQVQSQLHASHERNLYRVVATGQQRCATCGRLSSTQEETCYACNSALEGHAPAEFYLMAESFRPEALVQDPELMARHLYHPSLVPVVDFFSHKPQNRTRYYAVAEPRGGVRLSQLSLPRPATQVLTWAMQLADALDYLHNQGVVGAEGSARSVSWRGQGAPSALCRPICRASGGCASRTRTRTAWSSSCRRARSAPTISPSTW
jgi:serine/threonine protein kinase